MAKSINYHGYGEVHGLREWARLLEVNKDTLRYWLTTKGLTVEEFARKNNIDYKPKDDTGRSRTNRRAQAEARLYELFTRSGYDTDLLKLEHPSEAKKIQVFYDDEKVGEYTVTTGSLIFKKAVCDEGVNLLDYPIPEPKIMKYAEGWGLDPESKKRLLDEVLNPAPTKYPIIY